MPETPYEPKYKGFDEAATDRARKTYERAKESEGAQGEDANKEYVDDGPAEYERRTGHPMDVPKGAKEAKAAETTDDDA